MGGSATGGDIGSAARAAVRIAATGAIAARALLRAGRARRAGGDAAARWARAAVLADASRRVLALHGVTVRASGPLPVRPVLLAANHVSYLDPLAVAAWVACAPISKADLAHWPVFGAVARRTGVLFHERGDARSGMKVMREARRALEQGLPVLNFPEGTTSAGAGPLPFRPGLFGVARRAGVPVVPVAIACHPPELAWVGDATFVPHFLALAAREASEVRLTFGPPLRPEAYASAHDLAAAARACVSAMLDPRADSPPPAVPALAGVS